MEKPSNKEKGRRVGFFSFLRTARESSMADYTGVEGRRNLSELCILKMLKGFC